MTMEKGSLASIKEKNRRLVIDCLRHAEGQGVTRAELARETDLTPSTISHIIGELLDSQLIQEIGAESADRTGRKGILLQINVDRYCTVGYEVGSLQSRIAVCNGGGQEFKSLCFDTARGSEALKQQIGGKIKTLLNLKPVGVGFAFPGQVDPRAGKVIRCRSLGLQDFDLAFLDQSLGLTALVENSVTAKARMILTDPQCDGNFVVLHLGTEVRAAIVMDRKILRGSGNAAGEVGHMMVNQRGSVCSCGKKGCLETEASLGALVSHYRALTGQEAAGQDLWKLALAGDSAAREAFEGAGKYLGIAVSNLVNLVNPSVIYVTGELSQGWQLMEKALQNQLDRHCFDGGSVRFQVLSWDEQALARGTAAFAFERYLQEQIKV